MDKFILIGGMPRSGTNLTRRIIGSHSKIAIPPAEFQFFKKYERGRTIQEIFANKRLVVWQIDFSDLHSLKPQDAYVMALRRYTEKIGKEIPGEKSPLNEFYLDKIEAWLRDFDLKFIHMVRNPFDVIASYKHKPSLREKGNDDAVSAPAVARNWRRSVSLGLARAHLNHDRYFLLKYEDLTADPVGKTRELCAFIGINMEEERMLDFSDFANDRDNTSFSKDEQKSATNYRVYQSTSRKQYLTKWEIAEVGKICGELAWALGYDDERFHLSPPEGHGNSGFISQFRQWYKSSGRFINNRG